MSNYNYLSAELLAVAPFPVNAESTDQFKIKIHSQSGETKWLNITAEQFKAIELVLLAD